MAEVLAQMGCALFRRSKDVMALYKRLTDLQLHSYPRSYQCATWVQALCRSPRDVLAKSVQGPWTLWALTVYVRHELTWSRTATQCLTDIVMEHGDPLSVPDPVLRYVCRTPPLVPNSQTSKYHCAVSVSCRCQSSFLRTLFHVETSSRSCL